MKTILIVDDHVDTRIICRELLGFYGYQVREAADGAGALAAAHESRPDLILLDFLMPDRDGVDVLAELRAQPATAATPVVLFTAAASHADELRRHPQVTGVLLKPIEAQTLLGAVKALIGGAEVPA